MCKCNYSKGPLKSHFPVWNLRILPTLGDSASPVREGRGRRVQARLAAEGWLGIGVGLDRFTAEGRCLPGRRPHLAVAAARNTAGSLPRPRSGPSKPPFLPGAWALEVGLFRSLSPEQEAASRGLPGPRVRLEAPHLGGVGPEVSPGAWVPGRGRGTLPIGRTAIVKSVNGRSIFVPGPGLVLGAVGSVVERREMAR